MHSCSTKVLSALVLICCIGHVAPGPAADDLPQHSSANKEITIDPHDDLPTRFGDEDDVIAKKHAALVPPESPGRPSKKRPHGSPKKQPAFGMETDEEDYDEEDEENDDVGGKGERDESHYKSGDYGDELEDDEEEEDGELGPPLENFGDTKLDGGDTSGDQLPVFLLEPESTFVIRSRAAVLKCQAAHALKVGIFWVIEKYI